MSRKNLFSKPVEKRTMAEQMAETIKELILTGKLAAGENLPTEPELAEQFGVSRAVVRDATRILMALGLVEVRHGSGVYVSASQAEAFGEALLIALRRAGAMAWDVEQFQQVVVPEVIALAATAATDAEIADLRQRVADFETVALNYQTKDFAGLPISAADERAFIEGGRQITLAIFEASHNQLFVQLAEPLISLRNLRHWADDPAETPEMLVGMELRYYRSLIDAIASRDPAEARARVKALMALPPEAVEAMQETPVGEQPQIPISVTSLWGQGWLGEGE